jgi:hypothetical protein
MIRSMRQIVIAVALLGACKAREDHAAVRADHAAATEPDGEWRPRHRDKHATELHAMPTRKSTVSFSKLAVRATITLPTIYVVGNNAGVVNEVRELPAEACSTEHTICDVPFHAESLHFPLFQLRVGPVPSGEEWQCDAKRCVRDWRRPGKYTNELELQRAYKIGEDALYCTAWHAGTKDKVTSAVEAWMVRICDELVIAPL